MGITGHGGKLQLLAGSRDTKLPSLHERTSTGHAMSGSGTSGSGLSRGHTVVVQVISPFPIQAHVLHPSEAA